MDSVAALGGSLDARARRAALTAAGTFGPMVISELLVERSTLELVASRSYRHVNHFDKIVLVDGGAADRHRLTMHRWCPPYPESELSEELIHDHRFGFTSQILFGQLRSRCYTAVGESSGDVVASYGTFRNRPEIVGSTTVSNTYDKSANPG